MKLAVFLPNWIGDVIMATPALRALRRHFGPEASIVGIAKPYVAPVLEGTPWLNDLWLVDPGSVDPGQSARAMIRRLRAMRIDTAVLFPNSFRTAWIAWRGGARQRAGYVRYGRGPLLNVRLFAPMEGDRYSPCSTLDYYLEIAYALGCPPEPPRMELAATACDETQADEVWRALGLRNGRVVAFNSGGAYGIAKHWPDEYGAELARMIVGSLDHDVLVLCGPGEQERAATLAGRAGPRVFSLAGFPPSIGLTKASVRRSRLLVSTDSGPRHFGAAFGVPVVALFGPTHMAWTDTHYEGETRLQMPVACGPCQQRVCPHGHHRCMWELTAERVYEAVRNLLERTGGTT
jgi:heptosyltransferase-2